jgi:hypothetical protein
MSLRRFLEAASGEPPYSPSSLSLVPLRSSQVRFLLFPPLIVMGYELLGHSHVPGWIKRPALLPVICLVTAGIGLIAKQAIHPSFLAVMVTVACSVIVVGIFDLRMPPALAIGVLPFVIRNPDYRYPLSVFIGTTALTLAYSGYRRLLGIYPTHVAEIHKA